MSTSFRLGIVICSGLCSSDFLLVDYRLYSSAIRMLPTRCLRLLINIYSHSGSLGRGGIRTSASPRRGHSWFIARLGHGSRPNKLFILCCLEQEDERLDLSSKVGDEPPKKRIYLMLITIILVILSLILLAECVWYKSFILFIFNFQNDIKWYLNNSSDVLGLPNKAVRAKVTVNENINKVLNKGFSQHLNQQELLVGLILLALEVRRGLCCLFLA